MDSTLSFITGFVSGLALMGVGAVLFSRLREGEKRRLSDNFSALAAQSLHANNEAFLHLAETRMKQSEQMAASTLDRRTQSFDELVKPMKETLSRLDAQVQALEVKREGAYRELMEMVRLSQETQQQLRGETGQLLQALRTPTTRGQWGEFQLKRILEMTGMREYARDFSSQQTTTTEQGTIRPDYIINLPGQRSIVIDSKVPLTAYLDAAQMSDAKAREAAMLSHAKQVREHVRALASKAYWSQIEGTPEFVVLFIPGDHFLAAALDYDAELMDYSIQQKVVLATPMTIIALLRTVAHGWRQENLQENTRRIGAMGAELYTALFTMSDHIGTLGSRLMGSIESYNKFVGSLERNVLTKARRLRDFGASKEGKLLPDALEPIEQQARSVEFLADAEEAKEDAA